MLMLDSARHGYCHPCELEMQRQVRLTYLIQTKAIAERARRDRNRPPVHVLFVWGSSRKFNGAALAKQKAHAELTWNGIHNELLPNRRKVVHFVHLKRKHSASPLFGPGETPTSATGSNLTLARALRSIPRGAQVVILVRSATGLTTNFAALVNWVNRLRDQNGPCAFRLGIFFRTIKELEYERAEGREFCQLFTSIRQGQFGFCLKVPIDDLVSDRPAEQANIKMKAFFDALANCRTKAERQRLWCRSYRNTLMAEEERGFREEIVVSSL